jgi:hypothetical protein
MIIIINVVRLLLLEKLLNKKTELRIRIDEVNTNKGLNKCY